MRARGLLMGYGVAVALSTAVLPAQVDTLTNVPDAVTRQTRLKLAPMPRAALLYATNCQGCHGHLGVSVNEIPALAGRIGYFVRIPEGRAYLVQVPNVAMNPGSDQDVADMLNWALEHFSRAQLPTDFRPYSAREVGELRKQRIDVTSRRRWLVEQLVSLKQVPSEQVLARPSLSLY